MQNIRKKPSGDKETWWWNNEVQEVVKARKEPKKTWKKSRRQEDEKNYMIRNNKAKKGVARAKVQVLNKMYEELKTHGGERKILRIAKVLDEANKHYAQLKQIKDENEVLILI